MQERGEEISARLAGEFIAEKLEIKSNDPILIRKRERCFNGRVVLSKLQIAGIVNESLDRILSGQFR